MSHGATVPQQSTPVARRSIYAFEDFELDPQHLELRHAGKLLKADPLALRLLTALVERGGELITKQELIAQVWGGRAVSDNVLTVAMARLRKALSLSGDGRPLVSNVFGRGYRFALPVELRDGNLEPLIVERSTSLRGTPWVGRESVMKVMRGTLVDVSSGRGHAFVVSGEAGIGKTRAVEELTREAEAKKIPVIWAYCRERGATPPLWPFAQLMRGVLAHGRLDLRDERVVGWMRELSPWLPQPDRHGGAALARTAASTTSELSAKHRLFDAITQLLLSAATLKPLVLVLDDVHQADAGTVDLLRYLVDEVAHGQLLVLLTLRTPLSATCPGTALGQLLAHRNCTCAPLERLSEQAVTAYVAATLGDRGERAARFARAIFARSEGNPFFMHELLRQIEAAPQLEAEALQVSSAAREIARQRLLGLDDRSIAVLSCAAVIGRSFELPLLQAVTGLELPELMASLESAWGCEVLVPAPDSRTAFVFDHELLREALYQRLTPSQRRAWHRAVAVALEQRTQAGDALPVCSLAHHLYMALPECELRRCVQHCMAAAEEAGQAHAYADGARYLAHAREALDLLADGSPRLRLKLLFGQALYARASASADCERLIHEALSLARGQRDAVMFARAVLLMDLHTGFPPLPGAQAALEEALAMLPEAERGLRAALLARRATAAPYAFDAERSAAQVAAALDSIWGSEAPYARFAALNAQLYLRGGPADRSEASLGMLELQALCARQPRLYSLPPALLELHRAIAGQQAGDLAAQDAALVRCERLASVVGSRELLWHCQRFKAHARINAGELAGGTAALEELQWRAEREALSGVRLLCAYDQVIVLARAPVDAHCELLAPDPADGPSVWSTKVRVLAALGERRAARAALSLVRPDGLARLPWDRDYLGTLGALTHASIALGADEYMAALDALLEPHTALFAAHIAFHCEGSVAQLRGLLAHRLGHERRAAAQLAAGLARCEQAGFGNCAEQARKALAGLHRA